MGIFVGSTSLGQAFPNLESFSNARAAALKIFEIIDLYPVINITSDAGKKITDLKGIIQFKNVSFRYPARPDVQVKLQMLDFVVVCCCVCVLSFVFLLYLFRILLYL